MEHTRIGDFAITKIVESCGPTFELNFLLPDAEHSFINEHRDWLFPTYIDPDSEILIASFHSYLIRTAHHNILIDTCVGNDKERPGFPEMHCLRTDYLSQLKSVGLSPEDIDYVMCTHMHPDHVGWNTRLENGQWVPTFANAKYLFGRTEFDAWQAYHNDIAGSDDDPIPAPISQVLGFTFEDSVLPVIRAKQALMIEDGHEIESGMTVESAPGHTPGNFVVNLVSKGRKAILSGDLMHHPIQVLRPEWSSGFCADPVLSAETRRHILERISDTNTLVLPAHFPTPTWGVIQSSSKGFRFSPTE